MGSTGLLNRASAVRNLERALAQAARGGEVTAALYIDLDKFKQANDSHGHQAGDYILRQIGARLLSMVRDGDVVARLGGDEFFIIVEHVEGLGEMRNLATRIIAAISEPIVWQGVELRVGASIGVAITQGDEIGADRLMAFADQEMFTSKRKGGGMVALFDYRSFHAISSSVRRVGQGYPPRAG